MPDPLDWFHCPQPYCGQYFMFPSSRVNTQVTCPNCKTAYHGEESDDPPDPPEALMLMSVAGGTRPRAQRSRTKR